MYILTHNFTIYKLIITSDHTPHSMKTNINNDFLFLHHILFHHLFVMCSCFYQFHLSSDGYQTAAYPPVFFAGVLEWDIPVDCWKNVNLLTMKFTAIDEAKFNVQIPIIQYRSTWSIYLLNVSIEIRQFHNMCKWKPEALSHGLANVLILRDNISITPKHQIHLKVSAVMI